MGAIKNMIMEVLDGDLDIAEVPETMRVSVARMISEASVWAQTPNDQLVTDWKTSILDECSLLSAPEVGELISLFKEHLGDSFNGWDLAAFLLQPNSYLSGVKPIELILNEPKSRDRVIEIAKAHLLSPDVY